jgi:hypothetical protein
VLLKELELVPREMQQLQRPTKGEEEEKGRWGRCERAQAFLPP